MENPCKKVEVFDVGYRQLDAYIAHCFGLPDFEGSLDSPNNVSYSIIVGNDTYKPSKLDEETLRLCLKAKGCEAWGVRLVLNEMCHLGFLEPGKYIINVSW